MLEIQKILAPTDFSERARAAAIHAAAISKRFEAELVFLHAVPPGPYDHASFDFGFSTGSVWPDREDIEARLLGQLEEFALRNARNARWVAAVEWGDPTGKIEEIAGRESADLIVLPTHGYGPFRRFALGSVTAKVLHDLKTPVWTGAHVEDAPPLPGEVGYACVACAVDGSEHSEAVLRWAAGFAARWRAELHAIHAGPALDAEAYAHGGLPENLREAVTDARAQRIADICAKAGCTPHIHVDCEEVNAFVLGAIEDAGADLLVIGRGAEKGVLGRLRTHSFGLIRESPCPVVSV